jgi:hypothetical protein
MMISLDPDVSQLKRVELKLAFSIILPRARPPNTVCPKLLDIAAYST